MQSFKLMQSLIEAPMNCTEKEAKIKNFMVFDGLVDLFRLLKEHSAIIGRNHARIVVDLGKTPSIIMDEINDIFQSSKLLTPIGFLSIFSDFETDSDTEILLMNIARAFTEETEIFDKFPAFREIQGLLKEIPALSPENSAVFDAMHEVIESNLLLAIAKSSTNLLDSLSGESENNNFQENDTRVKTLN